MSMKTTGKGRGRGKRASNVEEGSTDQRNFAVSDPHSEQQAVSDSDIDDSENERMVEPTARAPVPVNGGPHDDDAGRYSDVDSKPEPAELSKKDEDIDSVPNPDDAADAHDEEAEVEQEEPLEADDEEELEEEGEAELDEEEMEEEGELEEEAEIEITEVNIDGPVR